MLISVVNKLSGLQFVIKIRFSLKPRVLCKLKSKVSKNLSWKHQNEFELHITSNLRNISFARKEICDCTASVSGHQSEKHDKYFVFVSSSKVFCKQFWSVGLRSGVVVSLVVVWLMGKSAHSFNKASRKPLDEWQRLWPKTQRQPKQWRRQWWWVWSTTLFKSWGENEKEWNKTRTTKQKQPQTVMTEKSRRSRRSRWSGRKEKERVMTHMGSSDQSVHPINPNAKNENEVGHWFLQHCPLHHTHTHHTPHTHLKPTDTFMLTKALPKASLYEESYMHRGVVTRICVASTEFIINASRDGQLKFWKNVVTAMEFAKEFRAHLGQNVPLLSCYFCWGPNIGCWLLFRWNWNDVCHWKVAFGNGEWQVSKFSMWQHLTWFEWLMLTSTPAILVGFMIQNKIHCQISSLLFAKSICELNDNFDFQREHWLLWVIRTAARWVFLTRQTQTSSCVSSTAHRPPSLQWRQQVKK